MHSHVQLFVTPWTEARQAPLSMDSPGKNTGVGCHFLFQGIFPELAGRFFLTTEPAGKVAETLTQIPSSAKDKRGS